MLDGLRSSILDPSIQYPMLDPILDARWLLAVILIDANRDQLLKHSIIRPGRGCMPDFRE
jgi:hypothetical protein